MSTPESSATTPPAVALSVPADTTAEEVAVLVAVLAAASGGGEPADTPEPSGWAAHGRSMRGPHHHGRGAWRSALRG